MKAQMLCNCPDAMCHGALMWISCEAWTYHFVVEEDGLQYSVWEHTGSHRSHPHPPSGRQPPHSIPPPWVNTKPLMNPRPNPHIAQMAVHKSQEHHGDTGLSIKLKKTAALAQVISQPDVLPLFMNTNPLALPHAASKGVSRNWRHYGDARELIQSKGAASVWVTTHKREGDTSWVVGCYGCGEVCHECDNKGGPSDLAWSCTDCRGVVIWRVNRWVTHDAARSKQYLMPFHSSINQYALFHSHPKSKQYPTQIVSKERKVTLLNSVPKAVVSLLSHP